MKYGIVRLAYKVVIQKLNGLLLSMGCRLRMGVWIVRMWTEFIRQKMGFIYGPVINIRVPVTTA